MLTVGASRNVRRNRSRSTSPNATAMTVEVSTTKIRLLRNAEFVVSQDFVFRQIVEGRQLMRLKQGNQLIHALLRKGGIWWRQFLQPSTDRTGHGFRWRLPCGFSQSLRISFKLGVMTRASMAESLHLVAGAYTAAASGTTSPSPGARNRFVSMPCWRSYNSR